MRVTFSIHYPDTTVGRRQWNRDYSLNAIYAGKHWAARKADADYWHILTLHALRKVDKQLFDGPVRIIYCYNDKLDLSNHSYIAKMIEDALKKVIIADDKRGYVDEIVHRWHDEDKITVIVEPMA